MQLQDIIKELDVYNAISFGNDPKSPLIFSGDVDFISYPTHKDKPHSITIKSIDFVDAFTLASLTLEQLSAQDNQLAQSLLEGFYQPSYFYSIANKSLSEQMMITKEDLEKIIDEHKKYGALSPKIQSNKDTIEKAITRIHKEHEILVLAQLLNFFIETIEIVLLNAAEYIEKKTSFSFYLTFFEINLDEIAKIIKKISQKKPMLENGDQYRLETISLTILSSSLIYKSILKESILSNREKPSRNILSVIEINRNVSELENSIAVKQRISLF